MAITTPTSLQVPAGYETMLAKMAAQPLQKVLENVNYLYTRHRPPLASVCLTTAGALTRTARFIVPILPSADSVAYGMESRVYCSAACNLTIVIDYCTAYAFDTGGPWTNLINHTGGHLIAVAGAGLVTQVDHAVIPSNAVALRVQYSVSVGNHTPQHFLAYPTPDAPLALPYPSGFSLFDDGMLASGEHSPITTEHVNRCRASADAIRRDRWQCLYSWCQDEAQASARVVLNNISVPTVFPRVQCFVPGQALMPNTLIEVTVLAICTNDDTVTGVGKVALAEVDTGRSVKFDAQKVATVTLQSALLQVMPQGDGPMRLVVLELSGFTAITKKTYIHSLMVLWRPGD